MESIIIKAAIIDDEMHCLKTLRYQIEKQFKDIRIVFVTTDSKAAKSLVEQFKPDIVFLDIEMPEMNGLQFLAQFEDISFKVIFTTAYDQYAIKAIRLNALDYLLKPVDRHELEQAIEKYRRDKDKTTKEQVTQLHLFREKKIRDTIALSSSQGLFFVKISDIMYLQGDDCYTHVIMNDGKKYLVSKTLANFDDILTDDNTFFRAHKSYIINLKFIKQYIRGDGGEILMADNNSVSLSRNKKEDFLKLFTKV
jgi:two-component system, LytTR family, response regulator